MRIAHLSRIVFQLSAVAAVALFAASSSQADMLEDAAAAVERFAGPQTVFEGPTEAPPIAPDKHIVYLSLSENNDASRQWGLGVKEAGEKIGWEVTVIDGQGSPVKWLEAVNQAIALGADGFVTSADVRGLQDAMREAVDRGMIIIGIHGTALPGPDPELNLWYNIQQDPREIGKAQADWVINHSGGKARVVVTSHNEYLIAETKSTATANRIRECAGCELLEYSNTPIAEAEQRQPQLIASWIQNYGTPLYITAVADYTLDFQVPALRSGGVDPEDVFLVGADGTPSAYARIRRGGQYQHVTVSEPFELQGYQAIDEFNRAFNGLPPSGYVQSPYLVTPDNVDAEGGVENIFRPSSNYREAYSKLWGVE